MLEYNKFKDCENEYRSAPFWSWNDKLEQGELIKQLHEMQAQGMGGFFMHVRGGFTDEYLGENHMKAIKVCVEEADRLGMKAWIYDEDFASSGYAGGKILRENPKLAAMAIEIEKVNDSCMLHMEDAIAVFPYPDPQADQKLVFRMIRHDPAPHHDHQSYTDLCNKDTVDSFIAITHEKYKEFVAPYFNGAIPGVFTDEPHFSPEPKGTIRLPWTRNFQEEFKKIKGYDILPQIDKLLIKTEGCEKIRFDYWEVISGMFTRAYMESIYRWCEENKLKFTGHFYEDIYPDPIRTGSVMPNYVYFHIPGIDMLFNTEVEREQFGNVFIVKEVSSVGNQFKKERVLSETYGGSGWELNFEDQKKMADWQFALGINFICQHLVHYSLRGYRKRDYPLSFFAHQPWWKCYRLLGDYIGRLSYVLSQGKFVADILILHSSSSTWVEYNPEGNSILNEEIGCSIRSLTRNVTEIQYFFDLGDDILIERHGKVKNGKVFVGNSTYRTVILPSMPVTRSSSLQLLKQFMEQGGTIICTGITPKYLDGVESSELQQFFNSDRIIRAENNRPSLKRILAETGCSHVLVVDKNEKDPRDIYCHLRNCDDKQILFLCNISKIEGYQILLKLDGLYQVEEWNAVNGSRSLLNTIIKEDQTWLELEFSPVASYLLILTKETCTDPKSPVVSGKVIGIVQVNDWKVNRTDYNALTLNRCRAVLDGGEWEQEDNVLNIDDRFKDRLGLERASIFARQPWTFTEEMKNNLHTVEASYVFTVGGHLEGALFLAAEFPDVFKIFVNGKHVEPSGETYKDRAFFLYDIWDAVIPGKNEVIMNTNRYGALASLESIYIIGDFKLEKAGSGYILTKEDQILAGDWTTQGYPYYSGCMNYFCTFDLNTTEFSKVEFEFDAFQGVAVKVLVNQQDAGTIGWKPYKVDLTPYVCCGRNHIELQVMNSLQNMLGPHHYLPREGVVAPESFYCAEDVKFISAGFHGKGVFKIYGLEDTEKDVGLKV